MRPLANSTENKVYSRQGTITRLVQTERRGTLRKNGDENAAVDTCSITKRQEKKWRYSSSSWSYLYHRQDKGSKTAMVWARAAKRRSWLCQKRSWQLKCMVVGVANVKRRDGLIWCNKTWWRFVSNRGCCWQRRMEKEKPCGWPLPARGINTARRRER